MNLTFPKISGIAINFTFSSLFKTFSSMAVSLLAIKMIGPEKLGVWQAALILKPYMGFLQLGLTEGLGRELPFLMGQKKMERVKQYASTVQIVTLIYTFSSLILAVLLIIFFAEGMEDIWVILTAGVFISTMFVDNYLSSTYRSSRSFKELSKVYYITSIFGLILTPLIYFYGFKGYLGLLLVHSVFSTILLVIFRPIRVSSNFTKTIYYKNIRVGFPILSLNFLRNIPDTYPRLLILFFLSTTALGLTAPANAMLTVFAVLPASLAKYIYPKMTYEFGKTRDRIQLWKTSKKLALYLSILGIFGLSVIFFIPYVVVNFFPKYEAAVKITMIAIPIGFFRMYSILYNIFNTLKSYKEQFLVSVFRNILYLSSPLLFYFFSPVNGHLTNIFFGVLIAEALSSLVMFYFVYKVTHLKKQK